MNDPEIIKKLDEIKEEISKINMNFAGIAIVGWIGAVIGVVVFIVIPWIRDFLD